MIEQTPKHTLESTISGNLHDGHIFEDGFQNPPTPYIEGTGQVDLNEMARQSREGERRPVMTMEQAMAQEGGFHNSHMVNPELHPVKPGEEVDLGLVQAAFKAARAAEQEEQSDSDIHSQS